MREFKMDFNLSGKKILIITSNTGVEKSELLVPRAYLKKLNVEITHAAIHNREITSYYSIKTDLINAGAKWLDQAVVISNKDASCLITSRQPKDLTISQRQSRMN